MKNRKNRIIIMMMFFTIVSLFSLQGYAAAEETPGGTRDMTTGEWAHKGYMSHSMTGPWAGMREHWRTVPKNLMGKIFLWERYLIGHRNILHLTEEQVDKIGSELNAQKEYRISNEAKRRVLILEIEEMLVKGNTDLTKVEEKLKTVNTLLSDTAMKEIRTLEKVLSILTPEQQKTAKEFMRESTFTRRIMAY